jgi:hypothetical protein
MDSFIFWQRWLLYTSILFAVSWIFFALYWANPLLEPYNRAIALLFWHSPNMPQEVLPFLKFILGPLGGSIACVYILLAYLAAYPFKKKEIWSRNAIIFAFSIWLIMDSSLCLYYGAYFQVYFINTFSFLQKALPLIFTWKEFEKKTDSKG